MLVEGRKKITVRWRRARDRLISWPGSLMVKYLKLEAEGREIESHDRRWRKEKHQKDPGKSQNTQRGGGYAAARLTVRRTRQKTPRTRGYEKKTRGDDMKGDGGKARGG